jgi:DNA-directed RNA polymerase II subunit RPB1
MLNCAAFLQSIRVCQADTPDNPDDPSQPLDENGQPIPKPQHHGCGHTQPLIRKEGLKLMLVNHKTADDEESGSKLKTEDRKNLPASACLLIFKKIPDADLHIMGLSTDEARPEWMILTVLPVPPPAVRPSVAVDGGTLRGEDDLTYSA